MNDILSLPSRSSAIINNTISELSGNQVHNNGRDDHSKAIYMFSPHTREKWVFNDQKQIEKYDRL